MAKDHGIPPSDYYELYPFERDLILHLEIDNKERAAQQDPSMLPTADNYAGWIK